MAQGNRDPSFRNKSLNELSPYPKLSAGRVLLFLLRGFNVHYNSDETEHTEEAMEEQGNVLPGNAGIQGKER